MTDSNDNRYGRNRNRWRKTYGYGPSVKPRIVSVFETATSSSFNLNLQKTVRFTDYHEIRGIALSPSFSYAAAQYDEGLIYFNNQSVVTQSFNFTFNNSPYVVYTLEEVATGSVRVNIYGETLPTTGECVAVTNVPFSGVVRYRAAAAPGALTFPLYVQDVQGISGNFWVVAGEFDLTNDEDYGDTYTIPNGVLEARATAYDVNGNFDANVATNTTAVSTTTLAGQTSAPINNKIHFIITSQQ